MDYYDPNKIVAEEEKVKVKFSNEIKNFGFYLNPGLKDLRPETKVDMPFFLVKFLILNDFCQVLHNPVETLKNELDAHASIVDLKNKHFYEVNKFLYNPKYLNEIFFDRIGSFVPLMIKDDFSEEDISKMSYEEMTIILKSRKKFIQFQNFFFNKNS